MSTPSIIDWTALPATAAEFKELYGGMRVIHPDDRTVVLHTLMEKAKTDIEWQRMYLWVSADIHEQEFREAVAPTDDYDDDDASFDSVLLVASNVKATEKRFARLHELFNITKTEKVEDYIFLYSDVLDRSLGTQLNFARDMDKIVTAVRLQRIDLSAQFVAIAATASRKIRKRKKRSQQYKEPPSKRVFIDLS